MPIEKSIKKITFAIQTLKPSFYWIKAEIWPRTVHLHSTNVNVEGIVDLGAAKNRRRKECFVGNGDSLCVPGFNALGTHSTRSADLPCSACAHSRQSSVNCQPNGSDPLAITKNSSPNTKRWKICVRFMICRWFLIWNNMKIKYFIVNWKVECKVKKKKMQLWCKCE